MSVGDGEARSLLNRSTVFDTLLSLSRCRRSEKCSSKLELLLGLSGTIELFVGGSVCNFERDESVTRVREALEQEFLVVRDLDDAANLV